MLIEFSFSGVRRIVRDGLRTNARADDESDDGA